MKRATIRAIQVRDTTGNEIQLDGKVTKVIIRNNAGSAQDLWVGINEQANSKVPLQPTDNLVLEAREGLYYDGNILRFAFESADPSNAGVVIIERETDNPVC